MSLSQKTLVFFIFMFGILTFLSGILDKKESFLATYLTSSIDADTLVIPVTANSTDNWPDSAHFWIGDEYIKYDSVDTDTDEFTVSEGDRGYDYGDKETTAKFHAVGSLVKAPEVDVINTLMGYDTIVVTTNVGDMVGLGLFVWNFIKSLPKMVMWDYSFLQGEMVIVKYLLLYPISAGFVVTFGMVFIAWARNLAKLI